MARPPTLPLRPNPSPADPSARPGHPRRVGEGEVVRKGAAGPKSRRGEGGGEEGMPGAVKSVLGGARRFRAGERATARSPALVSGATARKPALVREVLQFLPPPPDREVVLDVVEDGDAEDPVALALSMRTCFNPYFEIWMFQQLTKKEQEEAWMRAPLKLHDGGFVAAADSLNWGPELKERYLDVINSITHVLEVHPGPISCFRVDASKFPAPELLIRWIQILSEKQAQQVILLNLTGPEDTEVPLHHLRSARLTYLAVGFLSIRACLGLAFDAAAFEGHAWSSLTDLNLMACAFNGPDLSNTVRDLQGLKNLCIACCLLTAGCSQVGLCIASTGLVSVQLWRCTADRPLMFGEARALRRLTLGVSPARASSSSPPLQIKIEFCLALSILNDLHLQLHDVFISSDYTYRVNRRKVLGLPWLHSLGVAVEMATSHNARDLFSLLCFFPHLKNLTVKCLRGSAGDCDSQQDPSVDSPCCLVNSLRHLTMRQLRGGKVELAFLESVLSVARFLVSLRVEVLLPKDDNAMFQFRTREDADTFFRSSHRVSRECQIHVIA